MGKRSPPRYHAAVSISDTVTDMTPTAWHSNPALKAEAVTAMTKAPVPAVAA